MVHRFLQILRLGSTWLLWTIEILCLTSLWGDANEIFVIRLSVIQISWCDIQKQDTGGMSFVRKYFIPFSLIISPPGANMSPVWAGNYNHNNGVCFTPWQLDSSSNISMGLRIAFKPKVTPGLHFVLVYDKEIISFETAK
jgi:hypothetical protein